MNTLNKKNTNNLEYSSQELSKYNLENVESCAQLNTIHQSHKFNCNHYRLTMSILSNISLFEDQSVIQFKNDMAKKGLSNHNNNIDKEHVIMPNAITSIPNKNFNDNDHNIDNSRRKLDNKNLLRNDNMNIGTPDPQKRNQNRMEYNIEHNVHDEIVVVSNSDKKFMELGQGNDKAFLQMESIKRDNRLKEENKSGVPTKEEKQIYNESLETRKKIKEGSNSVKKINKFDEEQFPKDHDLKNPISEPLSSINQPLKNILDQSGASSSTIQQEKSNNWKYKLANGVDLMNIGDIKLVDFDKILNDQSDTSHNHDSSHFSIPIFHNINFNKDSSMNTMDLSHKIEISELSEMKNSGGYSKFNKQHMYKIKKSAEEEEYRQKFTSMNSSEFKKYKLEANTRKIDSENESNLFDKASISINQKKRINQSSYEGRGSSEGQKNSQGTETSSDIIKAIENLKNLMKEKGIQGFDLDIITKALHDTNQTLISQKYEAPQRRSEGTDNTLFPFDHCLGDIGPKDLEFFNRVLDISGINADHIIQDDDFLSFSTNHLWLTQRSRLNSREERESFKEIDATKSLGLTPSISKNMIIGEIQRRIEDPEIKNLLSILSPKACKPNEDFNKPKEAMKNYEINQDEKMEKGEMFVKNKEPDQMQSDNTIHDHNIITNAQKTVSNKIDTKIRMPEVKEESIEESICPEKIIFPGESSFQKSPGLKKRRNSSMKKSLKEVREVEVQTESNHVSKILSTQTQTCLESPGLRSKISEEKQKDIDLLNKSFISTESIYQSNIENKPKELDLSTNAKELLAYVDNLSKNVRAAEMEINHFVNELSLNSFSSPSKKSVSDLNSPDSKNRSIVDKKLFLRLKPAFDLNKSFEIVTSNSCKESQEDINQQNKFIDKNIDLPNNLINLHAQSSQIPQSKDANIQENYYFRNIPRAEDAKKDSKKFLDLFFDKFYCEKKTTYAETPNQHEKLLIKDNRPLSPEYKSLQVTTPNISSPIFHKTEYNSLTENKLNKLPKKDINGHASKQSKSIEIRESTGMLSIPHPLQKQKNNILSLSNSKQRVNKLQYNRTSTPGRISNRSNSRKRNSLLITNNRHGNSFQHGLEENYSSNNDKKANITSSPGRKINLSSIKKTSTHLASNALLRNSNGNILSKSINSNLNQIKNNDTKTNFDATLNQRGISYSPVKLNQGYNFGHHWKGYSLPTTSDEPTLNNGIETTKSAPSNSVNEMLFPIKNHAFQAKTQNVKGKTSIKLDSNQGLEGQANLIHIPIAYKQDPSEFKFYHSSVYTSYDSLFTKIHDSKVMIDDKKQNQNNGGFTNSTTDNETDRTILQFPGKTYQMMLKLRTLKNKIKKYRGGSNVISREILVNASMIKPLTKIIDKDQSLITKENIIGNMDDSMIINQLSPKSIFGFTKKNIFLKDYEDKKVTCDHIELMCINCEQFIKISNMIEHKKLCKDIPVKKMIDTIYEKVISDLSPERNKSINYAKLVELNHKLVKILRLFTEKIFCLQNKELGYELQRVLNIAHLATGNDENLKLMEYHYKILDDIYLNLKNQNLNIDEMFLVILLQRLLVVINEKKQKIQSETQVKACDSGVINNKIKSELRKCPSDRRINYEFEENDNYSLKYIDKDLLENTEILSVINSNVDLPEINSNYTGIESDNTLESDLKSIITHEESMFDGITSSLGNGNHLNEEQEESIVSNPTERETYKREFYAEACRLKLELPSNHHAKDMLISELYEECKKLQIKQDDWTAFINSKFQSKI